MRGVHRSGFTLVEMLVIVAILATLIALLLPSLAGARYAARLAVCSSGLRQMAVAHTTYATNEKGWYPYGATETRVIDGEVRWMLPTGTNPTQTQMLGPYLDGGDTLDPRYSELMRCPEGVRNLERNDVQTYAFYANRINAQGANQGPFYDTNSEGEWQKTWQYAKDESKLLRRVNDTMYYIGFSNAWGWSGVEGYYRILASDWTTRWFGTTTAYTNHVKGGDGVINGSKVQWYSGEATTNYAMTDGSVRGFRYPVTNFRDTMSMGLKTEGGAQTIIFPNEWAE